MKLVIKVASRGLDRVLDAHTLARAISNLLSDGHQTIIVHREDMGMSQVVRDFSKPQEAASTTFRVLESRVNRRLVAALGIAGVPALGLCATDGNIVRVRKKKNSNGDHHFTGEAASVDPHWLNTISKNGGVPVLANLGLGPDREYHWLDADQMAGACAIGWNADALIFLTNAEIPRNPDGSAMRWLDAEKVDDLVGQCGVSPGMLPKLTACREALKCGVRRTRILPLSQGESLACFYSVRIESGTEVILAV